MHEDPLPDLHIRQAGPDDGAAAAAVVRAVYNEYGFTWDAEGYHADLYDLRSHYLDAANPFWVAERASGTIVGTVALALYDWIPGARGATVTRNGKVRLCATDCSIERLYVHPEARSSGVGTALLRTALEEARRLGRASIEIWSDKRFDQARRLYQRFGAKVVAERINQDPDRSAEVGLLLRLKSGG